MSDKPDHYEVLGLKKTATLAEIKSAHTKIVMRNHPDKVKHKTDMTQAQKDAALALFKLATEAEKVLTDPAMRAAYDQFGHKGVENMATGKAAGSGQTYEQAAGGRMKRGPFTEEDTLSFFEKRAGRDTIGTSGGGTSDDGLTSAERRERARQERLKNRGKSPDASTPTSPPTKSYDSGSASNAFHDVAEKVSDAAERLKGSVAVPLDALEKVRESLCDFIDEIDKAIETAKRPNGPRP